MLNSITGKSCIGVFLLLIMAACAHEAYMYNYVLYDTEELALAAQVSDIQMVLSKVQRKDKPIGESCVVIVPSVEYLESMIKEAMI
jgi:hypothetical protein